MNLLKVALGAIFMLLGLILFAISDLAIAPTSPVTAQTMLNAIMAAVLFLSGAHLAARS